MKSHRTLGAVSLSTLLLLACAHTDDGPYPASHPVAEPRMGAENTQAANFDRATVDQLAAARCDREQSCNNVGSGQKYASRDVCTEQMRGSLGNDLNTYNCPRGLDRDALDRCMVAIRSEECGHLFDTISRVEKCRTGALCMK